MTDESGGLRVVPGSHVAEYTEKSFASSWSAETDHCELRESANKLNADPVLVKCRSGDLILWDTLLVHGGVVGKEPEEPVRKRRRSTARAAAGEGGDPKYLRMSCPVCMVPRSFASREVMRQRREAFEKGECLNHQAHKICDIWAAAGDVPGDATGPWVARNISELKRSEYE